MLRWINSRLDAVNLHVNVSNDEIAANCPFCITRLSSIDTKQHLYINKSRPVAHCFRCDWAGTWLDLVIAVDGCTFSEASAYLAGSRTSKDFDDFPDMFNDHQKSVDTFKIKGVRADSLKHYKTLTADDPGMIHARVVNYLVDRGIGDDLLYSGMFGLLWNDCRVVMWAAPSLFQARTMQHNVKPKYINRHGAFDIELGLWDSPYIGHQMRTMEGPIYLVEGIFSALSVIRSGRPAIALLGKNIRPRQLKRLVRFQEPLAVMLDKDAEEKSWELAARLNKAGKSDVSVGILEYGDPDDCHDWELYKVDWQNDIRYKLGLLQL